jgi:hypothetical protein
MPCTSNVYDLSWKATAEYFGISYGKLKLFAKGEHLEWLK